MSTDWDRCYREGETPWNRREASPPLREWLERNLLTGRVIVPGCGIGHDVALIAGQGADVMGLDISGTAIGEAKKRYSEIADRFVVGDLFSLDPALIGAFDHVVEHTCLSGMPPEWRPKYGEACRRLLKPEGRIVGVWFINPEMDPGETGPPFALPVEELDAMFDGDFQSVEDFIPAAAFPGREGRERFRVLQRLG